jgi:hypothetical protein
VDPEKTSRPLKKGTSARKRKPKRARHARPTREKSDPASPATGVQSERGDPVSIKTVAVQVGVVVGALWLYDRFIKGKM